MNRLAARIGHKLSRVFGQHDEVADLPPGSVATALAVHLSQNNNATFVWCGFCRRRLVGIVTGCGDGLEAVALACPVGHGALGIYNGIVLEPQPREVEGAG